MVQAGRGFGAVRHCRLFGGNGLRFASISCFPVCLDRILKRVLIRIVFGRVLHGSMCLCIILLETVVRLVYFLAAAVSTDMWPEIPLHMGSAGISPASIVELEAVLSGNLPDVFPIKSRKALDEVKPQCHDLTLESRGLC